MHAVRCSVLVHFYFFLSLLLRVDVEWTELATLHVLQLDVVHVGHGAVCPIRLLPRCVYVLVRFFLSSFSLALSAGLGHRLK